MQYWIQQNYYYYFNNAGFLQFQEVVLLKEILRTVLLELALIFPSILFWWKIHLLYIFGKKLNFAKNSGSHHYFFLIVLDCYYLIWYISFLLNSSEKKKFRSVQYWNAFPSDGTLTYECRRLEGLHLPNAHPPRWQSHVKYHGSWCFRRDFVQKRRLGCKGDWEIRDIRFRAYHSTMKFTTVGRHSFMWNSLNYCVLISSTNWNKTLFLFYQIFWYFSFSCWYEMKTTFEIM